MQLEALRMQLRAQAHAAALPEQPDPGNVPPASLPDRHLSSGDHIGEGLGEEFDDRQGTVLAREDDPPPALSEDAVSVSGTNQQDGHHNRLGMRLPYSRQSSISAQSYSDLAAAIAVFDAYAARPLEVGGFSVTDLPGPSETAAGQAHDASASMAAAEGDDADQQQEASIPLDSILGQHMGDAAPPETVLSPLAALLPSLEAGSKAETDSASSHFDEDEDPSLLLTESLLCETDGGDLPHICNPYSSMPYRYQHAIIRAVEPEFDSLSNSEDEAEMTRLEKKYNIVPSLTDRGMAIDRQAARSEIFQTQCGLWPIADASCYVSVRGQRRRH